MKKRIIKKGLNKVENEFIYCDFESITKKHINCFLITQSDN